MELLILCVIVLLVLAFLPKGPRQSPAQGAKPSAVTPQPSALDHHVSLVNAAIKAFDEATDIGVKFAQLPIVEREMNEILRLMPDNQAALQLRDMLPEKKAALIDQAAAEKQGNFSPTSLPPQSQGPSIDHMRAGLQKVAYGMVGKNVSADDKAFFKQDMTEFAAADPLVREIAERVQQLVAGSPGLLQSKIYVHFPGYDKEQVRYALYFAHELGMIHRIKKGNSYQLFPPGRVVDV